jgi:hypothetical protein
MKAYLSEKESEKLSLMSYVAAARRTLEELYLRRLHLESNLPGSEVFRLSPEDCKLLAGMKVGIKETGERFD